MTAEMTDKPAYYWDAPAKVRFGPFARYTGGPHTFGMDWSSPPGLVSVQISGCYDLATIVLNGKIIFNSVGGQGNRYDSVQGLVKNFNHMTLTLQGGCLAANAYVTIQPVMQLCPECGDMAGKDITIVGGYLTGYWYYMPADHPDTGTGPIAGDTPADHDWWNDRYFVEKSLWDIPEWCNLPPPPEPPTPPPHWECDPIGGGEDACAYSVLFKQKIYAPLDDVYTLEVSPYGDTWVYIDGELVFDSDWATYGARGIAYGEFQLEKGFHDLRIFHSNRDNNCEDCEMQFAFNFVPNVHADAEDPDYFNVDIWGDDEWEDDCFLNIW